MTTPFAILQQGTRRWLSDEGPWEARLAGVVEAHGLTDLRIYADDRGSKGHLDFLRDLQFLKRRDVDLFTSVCEVGDDETWSDQGDRGTGLFRERFPGQDVSSIIALRAGMLSRALPDTGMRWLKIPRKVLDTISLALVDVPIELDYRTETILRKAHVLADDWKIDSPELVRQLTPD